MHKRLTSFTALAGLALAATLGASAPAQAARLLSFSTEGSVTPLDFSANGLIALDLDFASLGTATLRYEIEAADLAGGGLVFNAVLRNLSPDGFSGYQLTLDRGQFAGSGTVTRQFGGASLLSFAGPLAQVGFDSPEYLDVELGNPLANSALKQDWALSGLAAGDQLALSVSAVPEPGMAALMLAGLAGIGFMGQRRRPR